MEKHPIACARCGADVSRDTNAGLTYCSVCGTALPRAEREREVSKKQEVPVAPRRAELDPETQRYLKSQFLFYGLTSPIVTVLLGVSIHSVWSIVQPSMLGFDGLITGAGAFVLALMAPSLYLSKLYVRPRSAIGVILSTVGLALGLAFGICVVLFSILYASCGLPWSGGTKL